MGSNGAFCLVIFGVLCAYCEFIWPGRVWQGVLGIAALVAGAHFLLQFSPTKVGLELVGGATICFLVDAYIDTNFLLGLAATWGLTAGFLDLIPGQRKVSPWVVVPLCVILGALTTALNWTARRARKNKRTVIQ